MTDLTKPSRRRRGRRRTAAAVTGAITLAGLGLYIASGAQAAPTAHSTAKSAADTGTGGAITGYDGLCLDDRSASTADFNPVQVYTCNGSSAQQWTVGS